MLLTVLVNHTGQEHICTRTDRERAEDWAEARPPLTREGDFGTEGELLRLIKPSQKDAQLKACKSHKCVMQISVLLTGCWAGRAAISASRWVWARLRGGGQDMVMTQQQLSAP